MILPLLASFQLASAAQVYNGRDNRISVPPPKIEADATIDGLLDEPVWRQAALLTGFSLYSPFDQRPSPDSTEVYVWYSSTAIYFGIRAFEPHAPVAATLAERDRIGSADNVEIHLDTFDERNRAFVFIVNALGVQADGTKAEGGGFIPGSGFMPGQTDVSADFVWQSRGHTTDWGYEVELRIPFSSLRYPVRESQRWGLQITRHVQHSGYGETWTAARSASATFIGQAGRLTDLTGMRHGSAVELNPELTNTVTGAPCCAPAQQDWHYDANPRIGGNLRWNIGSNFVLNGTVKPDFSQVEADATQIAADARFALFYAERRPFFVEGSDQFNVPNALVHTRTIVQPNGAAKFTGKLGRADAALLSAVDDRQSAFNEHRPLVDIVRLRQSFGQQSMAGFLYSDRVGDGRTNRMIAADTKIVFGTKYYAQFQAGGSATRTGGTTSSGALWNAVLDRTGKNFGFNYSVIGIQRGFHTDNGYVPRTDVVQPNLFSRYYWYQKPGSLIERFGFFWSFGGVWRYDDFFAAKSLREDFMSLNPSVALRGGWSIGVTPRVASLAFDPRDYSNLYTSAPGGPAPLPFVPSDRIGTRMMAVSLSTPRYNTFSATAGGSVGNDVDFFETSRVRRLDYNASVELRPDARLRVNATYAASAFTRPNGGERSAFTRIPRLKLEYQLARPMFVRWVAQYTAARREALRDPKTGGVLLIRSGSTFVPSTASVSNGLRSDWLFSYRPGPGAVFFFGYGGTASEPEPLALQQLRRTSDAFFVKLSYVFRMRTGT